MKITLKKDPAFVKQFKSYPLKFRIEAVIHDGQWYTPEKWAKVAKCTLNDVLDFIKNTDYLISNKGSYRVNKDEVLRWYEEENLDIEEPLVPNNFIPKIWDGKTEVEHFLNAPKRLINILLIYHRGKSDVEEIKKALKGHAFSREDDVKDTIRVFSVSNDYVISVLKRNLPKNVFDNLSFRVRNAIYWRHITDFSEGFIEEFLNFYVDYAKGLLKPHNKTIEIFIPNYQDRELKIQEWVLRAADKFDEKACVPFSGYLANVLQRWPYDLPNNELGIELAKFQRERTKAINKLTQERESEEFREEEIRLMLPYSREDYYRLLADHERWSNIKMATSLTWDDKGNEKVGTNVFSQNSEEPIKIELAHKLTLSLLEATVETGNSEAFFKVIKNFKEDTSIPKIELCENFKTSLWNNLKSK